MSDNVITFPTTHEAPPKAALEPIVIRIEVDTTGTGPLGAAWLFAAVCGVVSFVVVTALIG